MTPRYSTGGTDWGVLVAAPLLAVAAVVMATGALLAYVVLKPIEIIVSRTA